MHLLAPLAAGMAGAAGGSVNVYARGTTTPITLYTDFEGTITTSNPATLDANGRAKLYVSQYARCVVLDASGATVIDFVDGYDANGVEVRSASIVGNAYVGGAAAAGNPISVEAVVDKIITSFGSTDFNVLLAGSSVTLQSALGYLWRARVFDVKAYGALGDGATNDLNAINAASLAANAAGGGIVFFPPGTYVVSTTLTTYATVEYAGAGASLTTVRLTSDAPVIASGSGLPVRVRGIAFTFSASSFTYWIGSQSGAGKCLVQDCTFAYGTANNGNNGVFRCSSGSELRFIRCTMGMSTSSACLFGIQAAGSSIVCEDCSITQYFASGYLVVMSGTSSGQAMFVLDRCTVDYSQNGGQNCNGIWLSDYSTVKVRGCTLIPTTGSLTNNLIYIGSTTSTYLLESDNDFSASFAKAAAEVAFIAARSPYAITFAPTYALRGSRGVANVPPDSPNGAAITVFFSLAITHVIRTTSGSGTRAISVDGQAANYSVNGETATLAVHNDTGSVITYQWSSGFAASGTTFTVSANSVRAFTFVYIRERAKWFVVSDSAGAETAE